MAGARPPPRGALRSSRCPGGASAHRPTLAALRTRWNWRERRITPVPEPPRSALLASDDPTGSTSFCQPIAGSNSKRQIGVRAEVRIRMFEGMLPDLALHRGWGVKPTTQRALLWKRPRDRAQDDLGRWPNGTLRTTRNIIDESERAARASGPGVLDDPRGPRQALHPCSGPGLFPGAPSASGPDGGRHVQLKRRFMAFLTTVLDASLVHPPHRQ